MHWSDSRIMISMQLNNTYIWNCPAAMGLKISKLGWAEHILVVLSYFEYLYQLRTKNSKIMQFPEQDALFW